MRCQMGKGSNSFGTLSWENNSQDNSLKVRIDQGLACYCQIPEVEKFFQKTIEILDIVRIFVIAQSYPV